MATVRPPELAPARWYADRMSAGPRPTGAVVVIGLNTPFEARVARASPKHETTVALRAWAHPNGVSKAFTAAAGDGPADAAAGVTSAADTATAPAMTARPRRIRIGRSDRIRPERRAGRGEGDAMRFS